MSKKTTAIIKLMDGGMSRSEAEYEWENNIAPMLQELDAYKEFDAEDFHNFFSKLKKKFKKKNTKVASLRSSKDKKFMGHTGRG